MATELDNHISQSRPARIIRRFLGTMLALLLATVLIGQLNLPYYGVTAWDLGVAILAWLGNCLPLVTQAIADQYPFVTGAIGALWLTIIYFRVQRTGRYLVRAADGVLGGVAVALYVVYFVYLADVLPLGASAVYRVALYCAISLLVFCVGVMVGAFSDRMGRISSDASCLPLVGFVIASAFTLFATGSQGEGFVFCGLNVVLHLFANFGAAIMGLCFQGIVASQARQRDKPRAAADLATVG